jgi:hypothetical protein
MYASYLQTTAGYITQLTIERHGAMGMDASFGGGSMNFGEGCLVNGLSLRKWWPPAEHLASRMDGNVWRWWFGVGRAGWCLVRCFGAVHAGARSSFGFQTKIIGVAVDMEIHVTGMVLEYCIWMMCCVLSSNSRIEC